MDASMLSGVWDAIVDYWPHIAGGAVPVIGALMAFVRRPKSTRHSESTYLEDEKLLAPPLSRPAYSDRMAYVLAEMADLAYYQFEGASGFLNDAIENAKRVDLTVEANIREFLDSFSAEMMGGHRLSVNAFSGILEKSGFSLVGTINVGETQGFVCKRIAPNQPAYLVLAFRGTEKKISDWLTDARCVPTSVDGAKVHTGFLEAFTKVKDPSGRTVEQVVNEILSKPEAREGGQPLPLFITGHSLGGALAMLATKLVVQPETSAACYTFGAPRVASYEFFDLVKTPVYRVVNSSDVVPRVPPGAVMFLVNGLLRGIATVTFFAPPVSAMFAKLEEFADKLSGYRHHGDQRYLTDVAEGQFHNVRLLEKPASDRPVCLGVEAARQESAGTREESRYGDLSTETTHYCECQGHELEKGGGMDGRCGEGVFTGDENYGCGDLGDAIWRETSRRRPPSKRSSSATSWPSG